MWAVVDEIVLLDICFILVTYEVTNWVRVLVCLAHKSFTLCFHNLLNYRLPQYLLTLALLPLLKPKCIILGVGTSPRVSLAEYLRTHVCFVEVFAGCWLSRFGTCR